MCTLVTAVNVISAMLWEIYFNSISLSFHIQELISSDSVSTLRMFHGAKSAKRTRGPHVAKKASISTKQEPTMQKYFWRKQIEIKFNYKMSTDAVISSIMSSQINDSLTKVNHLMPQVEDSFSSVSTPTKFLPIIAELLAKMQNIVILSQKSNVSDSIPDEDDMRWDQSDVCQQSVLNLSNTSSLNDILEHEELFPTASSESDSSSIQSLSSTSSYNQVTFMLKVAPENVFSRQKFQT